MSRHVTSRESRLVFLTILDCLSSLLILLIQHMPSFFVREVPNGLFAEFVGEREKDHGKRVAMSSLCGFSAFLLIILFAVEGEAGGALVVFFLGLIIAPILFLQGNHPSTWVWRSTLVLDARQGKCIITRTARSPRFDSSQAFDVDDIAGFEAREESLGASHTLHVSNNGWNARGSGYTTYHKQTRGFIVLNSNVAIPINCTSYLSAENLHNVLSSFNKALRNARMVVDRGSFSQAPDVVVETVNPYYVNTTQGPARGV
ncbi:hypothetical protein RCL1_006526 [Eukaryota sp. TZLM3-RCL]